MKKAWSTGYLHMLIGKKQKKWEEFCRAAPIRTCGLPDYNRDAITVLIYDLSLDQKKSLSKYEKTFVGLPRFEPAAFPITVLMYDLSLKQKKAFQNMKRLLSGCPDSNLRTSRFQSGRDYCSDI